MRSFCHLVYLLFLLQNIKRDTRWSSNERRDTHCVCIQLVFKTLNFEIHASKTTKSRGHL